MIEVIKFGADWCGPCRAIAPTIERLKEKYNTSEETGIRITDINIDENAEMSATYGIRSIPTMIFLKDGEIVEKKSGVLNETQIEDIISKFK